MQKRFLVFSGFSGAIAVALGAMGAHFLKEKISDFSTEGEQMAAQVYLQSFETGVRYQIFHTITLLVVALLADKINSKLLSKAGYCFMAGIVLFSGSLYLLSLGLLLGHMHLTWVGPVTPIGGLFLITGWLLLAFAGMEKRNQ